MDHIKGNDDHLIEIKDNTCDTSSFTSRLSSKSQEQDDKSNEEECKTDNGDLNKPIDSGNKFKTLDRNNSNMKPCNHATKVLVRKL